MIEDLLRQINVITCKNKVNPKYQQILEKKPAVKSLLINQYQINEDKDIKMIIRMIMDGQHNRPKCKICSNLTNYDFYKRIFKTYCSQKCSWGDPDNKAKIKKTKKERYGSENYNNRSKALQTIANQQKEQVQFRELYDPKEELVVNEKISINSQNT